MFLGKNLLVYLLLALGGALCAGNLLAIFRPPAQPKEGSMERAPVRRSLTMAAIGLVVCLWALASLVRK